MSNKLNLTTDSVSKVIISMTLPMIVGMLSTVAFNLIDTWFIGKLGTIALAAMSFTLPIVMLQGAISMGLGVGAAAIISKEIGKNDPTAVRQHTTNALILSVTLVIIVIIVGLLTIEPLFAILGATDSQLPLIKDYMFVWYLGVPFVVIPMVGNNAIRATGNTAIPSLIMFLSVGINTILDPLFIFGIGPFPRWELQGAAFATVISRMIALIISLSFLRFKFDMLTVKLESFATLWKSWKQILYIAVPAALTQMLMPLSIAFLTKLVSVFGDNAMAGLGVANRIEFFALSPLRALGAIFIPFTGQNLGARKYKRILEGLTFSIRFSLVVGVFVLVMFLLFKNNLAQLFTSNHEVISVVALYLSIVSIGYGYQGITLIGSSSFSALNKPFHAAGINILRLIVLFMPLALLGSHLWGLQGIFGAVTIASLISGLITQFWIRKAVGALAKES